MNFKCALCGHDVNLHTGRSLNSGKQFVECSKCPDMHCKNVRLE